MEDHILTTRYLVIIFILIFFLSSNILGYSIIMIILELKVDWLLKFLDTNNILYILTKILSLDIKFYLSKILWRTAY